jgi:Sulfotransferase domain
MKATKVFCIGFQKTGTTSMAAALETLGYRVTSIFGQDMALNELRRDYVRRGLQVAATVDAVQDMPWPLMYRELDRAFPGAKFVLTWRETDKWLASIRGHFGRNPAVLQALTYGPDAAFPVGNEDRYREVYDRHNAEVRAYFRERPGDLLEMDLGRGGGWEPLCAFLGEPVPATPFPTTNTARSRNSLVRRLRNRFKRLAAASAG